jgi:hypothetical protein
MDFVKVQHDYSSGIDFHYPGYVVYDPNSDCVVSGVYEQQIFYWSNGYPKVFTGASDANDVAYRAGCVVIPVTMIFWKTS